MDLNAITRIIEAILFSASEPLSVNQINNVFEQQDSGEQPTKDEIRKGIKELQAQYAAHSALELKEVASGFRFQVPEQYEPWVSALFDERPPRYSRALLETLAIIAYRQPVTRGEIEDIRGVAVSSHITKTLQERDWIRVLGHKDVPGKPAMFGTTKAFLDYFNIKSLNQLPSLAELRDLEAFHPQLDLDPNENDVPTLVENSAEINKDDTIDAGDVIAHIEDEGDSAVKT